MATAAAPPPYPTPEEVAALFPLYGLYPEPSRYLVALKYAQPCGCAVGALLCRAAGGVAAAVTECLTRHPVEALAAHTGWPLSFAYGIADGFRCRPVLAGCDGNLDIDYRGAERDAYRAGLALGDAAYRLVFAAEFAAATAP